MWEQNGYSGHVYQQSWPIYEEAKTIESTLELPVQINGKVKANISVALDEPQDSAVSKAMEHLVLKPLFEGKNIVKIIYVPGKILNFVVK